MLLEAVVVQGLWGATAQATVQTGQQLVVQAEPVHIQAYQEQIQLMLEVAVVRL
jgi:hypothetical protein